jgi:3-ketosteroid 9alpha-monooxygenase subunit B
MFHYASQGAKVLFMQRTGPLSVSPIPPIPPAAPASVSVQQEALPEKRQFHPLAVARIVRETNDARSIVFAVPRPLRPLFEYQAGQFLTLEVEYEGARLRRCYSLASAPSFGDEPCEHKVTVKRVQGGRVSNWLNDRLREGDTLSVLPPEGRFVLGRGEAPLLLFAGGSGITPVISIVKTALATTKRSVRLLYANRDASSVIFAEELNALALRHPDRLAIVHRFDDVHGFVDGEAVSGAVATLAVARATASDAECYLCGPSPFMATVERALVDSGIDPERVHVERFVSPADAPKAPAPPSDVPAPAEIGVTLSGQRHLVPYEPGKSILRAALDAGLPAPYSCEEGFCGCCVARLREGAVDMAADDALTPEEKARGFILTCQAKPRTAKCSVEYLEGV